MYALSVQLQPKPDSRKPQPILFSASSLPLIEGTLWGTDRLEGARNGRICVFPSTPSGKPGIFMQHELKISVPDETKNEVPLPKATSYQSEDDRRHEYESFRSKVLLSTLTERQDALGALEWDFYPALREFYVKSIATAGNAQSKAIDAFSMLVKEAERTARMLGAGTMILHSETILAVRLFALGYHLVPRESGFLPEYIKGLF